MIFNETFINSIIDIIIPKGAAGEPAASESRAADFINTYLEADGEKPEQITDLLNSISESGSQPDESIMKNTESRFPDAFSLLVELVYTAYYGDPEIVRQQGLPGPPQPDGHFMEPFNKDLLIKPESNKL